MKKRFPAIVLTLTLMLSLVPISWAAVIPDSVTYCEPNPYANGIMTGRDADGVYHYQITVAADEANQSIPLFLGSVHAYVTSSDPTIVGASSAPSYTYRGRKPGKATVTLSIRPSSGDYANVTEDKAVIEVTVLSKEDFAAYTGDDATRAVKEHKHAYTVAETPDTDRGLMLRRQVCTECGYWYNLAVEHLPDVSRPADPQPTTSTNPTPNPVPSADPKPTASADPEPTQTTDPSHVIPGVNSVSNVQKTGQTKPAATSNINGQNYERWYQPVRSHLYANADGGLTRVEYIDSYLDSERKVVVENYDSSFKFLSGWSMPLELPEWGGFYAGQNYNFIVYGQENKEEDSNKEVIRVVKYSKDWSQRLGQASLRGANTTIPFDGGSLRFAEYGDSLYIRTCHEMYASADGLNHQANMMLVVRESDMAVTDALYEVANSQYGYVSHSFNQFVLIDQQKRIVSLDHGDGGPRAAVINRCDQLNGHTDPGVWWGNSVESVNLVSFPGAGGDNNTGCSIGGFAETSNGYVTAYSYDGKGTRNGSRDLYLSFASKNLSASSSKLSSGIDVSTPVLASTGLNSGYVLWNQRHTNQGEWKMDTTYDGTVYYAAYDANGKAGTVKTASAALSDCVPIQYNGKTVWYVTDGSFPTFYTLDASGIAAYPLGLSYDSVAYANTQTVLFDGKPVTFQTYSLRDNYGGDTNFIKLRDLAHYLDGTSKQFSLDWKPGTISLYTGYEYNPNGSELSTPFSGNRPYREATDKLVIDVVHECPAEAIVLTDDQGGDYTYYKLRDLGRYLHFNVSYINGQVVVNTNEAYSDDQ